MFLSHARNFYVILCLFIFFFLHGVGNWRTTTGRKIGSKTRTFVKSFSTIFAYLDNNNKNHNDFRQDTQLSVIHIFSGIIKPLFEKTFRFNICATFKVNYIAFIRPIIVSFQKSYFDISFILDFYSTLFVLCPVLP